MNQYMRAWKNNALFSTGFHIRNQAENIGRSMAVGTTPLDLSKASAAMILDRGPWRKWSDEFQTMTKGMGLTSMEVKGGNPYYAAGERAGQATKDLFSTPELLERDNAMKRLYGSLQNAAVNGETRGFLKKLKDTANPRSKESGFLSDNPFYRFSAKAGENMENTHKLAYYARLREQGFNPQQAMSKVNGTFMNYTMTRGGVRRLQNAVPFANYMIKNAETTFRLLAMKPAAAFAFGPGGAIERSIHNWSEWKPDQVDQVRDMLGGNYYTDAILGPILPGSEAMIQNKDLMRDLVTKIMGIGGKGEGYVTWAKLPSNYHALLQANPTNMTEMSSPLIKMAIALRGVNPFTGDPMRYSGTKQQALDSLVAAADIAQDPIKLKTIWNGARPLMDSIDEDYMKMIDNLGMPDGALKLNGESLKMDKKSQEAFMKIKSLGTGGATKLNVDFFLRATAMLGSSRQEILRATSQLGTEGDTSHYVRALQNYKRTLFKIKEMRETMDDYDDRRLRMGGEADANVLPGGSEPGVYSPEAPLPETEQEYQDERGRRTIDENVNEINQMLMNREPQGKREDRNIALNEPQSLEEIPNIGFADEYEVPVLEKLQKKNADKYKKLMDFYKGKKGRYLHKNYDDGSESFKVVAFSPFFMAKADKVAQRIGTTLEDLLAVFAFETGGTFNPETMSATPQKSGDRAEGLLQWLPSTARELMEGQAVRELSQMEQLDLAEKYFRGVLKGKKNPTRADLYAAVLHPGQGGANIFMPPTGTLFEKGSAAYAANRKLDVNDDDKVTKAEAAAALDNWVPPFFTPMKNRGKAGPQKREAPMRAEEAAPMQMRGPSSEFKDPELAAEMDRAVARSPVKFSIDENGKVHAEDVAPRESGQAGLIGMVGDIVRGAMPFYQRYADEELKKWGNTPKGRRKVEELLHYELNQSEELYKKPENPQGDLFEGKPSAPDPYRGIASNKAEELPVESGMGGWGMGGGGVGMALGSIGTIIGPKADRKRELDSQISRGENIRVPKDDYYDQPDDKVGIGISNFPPEVRQKLMTFLRKEKGETLLHGTRAKFDSFSEGAKDRYGRDGTDKFYFTDSPAVANRFASGGRGVQAADYNGWVEHFEGGESDEESFDRYKDYLSNAMQKRDVYVMNWNGDGYFKLTPKLLQDKDTETLLEEEAEVLAYEKGFEPRVLRAKVSGKVLDLTDPSQIPSDLMNVLKREGKFNPSERSLPNWDHEYSKALVRYAREKGYGRIKVRDGYESGFRSTIALPEFIRILDSKIGIKP